LQLRAKWSKEEKGAWKNNIPGWSQSYGRDEAPFTCRGKLVKGKRTSWLRLKGACESDMDQQSLNGNGDQRLKRAHGAAHAEREKRGKKIKSLCLCGLWKEEGKGWHVTKGETVKQPQVYSMSCTFPACRRSFPAPSPFLPHLSFQELQSLSYILLIIMIK